MNDRGLARPGAVLWAVAAALLMSGLAMPLVVLGADPPPDPDAACARENRLKSTAGVTTATLTIINNTDQPVKSFWLDYSGNRVLYRQVAAHKQYKQATWLTHPWVIASSKGRCYRLVVMTSREQVVTVNPGTAIAPTPGSPEPVPTATPTPPPSASPIATPAPIPTPAPTGTLAPTTTPAAVVTAAPLPTVTPLTDPAVSSGTPPGGPDYTLGIVLGAGVLAAVAASVAAYWAAHTGRLKRP